MTIVPSIYTPDGRPVNYCDAYLMSVNGPGAMYCSRPFGHATSLHWHSAASINDPYQSPARIFFNDDDMVNSRKVVNTTDGWTVVSDNAPPATYADGTTPLRKNKKP